ncbi:MAG TPA: hypothetical protein VLX31_07420 [Streptosporangiaceae bacterium]|nr:hypothetical protein [Streptosporangiaceae bacterium]
MTSRVRHAAIPWAVLPFAIMISVAAASCAAGSAPTRSGTATLAVLTCRDSPGQQEPGAAPARLVNGVDGFIGDDNPGDRASVPVLHLNGVRYLAWKTALAIAPTARPYRIVSVVRPVSARLDYSIGKHAAAPSLRVRIPVCGDRYTLYVGGIFVRKPACVHLAVTGPGSEAASVNVPILTAHCPR